MIGYTKLFSSILESSVWGLSKEAKVLWITMLAKKDRDQIVRSTVPGLHRASGLSIEEVEVALELLARPDPYSTTPDHDGKRILRVADGWFIVTGEKYRDMLSKEDRREYQRVKQAERRARRKGNHDAGEAVYVRNTNNGVSDHEAMAAAARTTGDAARIARHQDDEE